MKTRTRWGLALLAFGSGLGHFAVAAAQPAALRPDQVKFRELYKELVETNTSLSVGSCTQAAAQLAGRLKAAGYPDADVVQFSAPDHPKEGGVVAVLHGTDPSAKAILLLAHLDVVEAKRADWTRDPFTLVEENGNFYARGVADDKAMAAVWADDLIRFREQGYHPKRTIKMALTCGEETTYAFTGANWLAKNRPDLVSAAFALNEGGGYATVYSPVPKARGLAMASAAPTPVAPGELTTRIDISGVYELVK